MRACMGKLQKRACTEEPETRAEVTRVHAPDLFHPAPPPSLMANLPPHPSSPMLDADAAYGHFPRLSSLTVLERWSLDVRTSAWGGRRRRRAGFQYVSGEAPARPL